MKRLIFFSDLHLAPQDDWNQYQIFLNLLRKEVGVPETTHLFLLGDIFDMFVGDFSFWREELKDFWNCLREVRMTNPGLEIIWIAGNHDFEFSQLARSEKIEMRDPSFDWEWNGSKFYFAHGDLVNLEDVSYLKWRQTTRSFGFRTFLKVLPNFLAKEIVLPLAQKVSQQSRLRGPRDEASLMKKLYRKFAEQKWQEGFSGVFLGHNHVEDLYQQGDFFYVNLGSWVEGEGKNYFPFGVWEYVDKKTPQICAGLNKV